MKTYQYLVLTSFCLLFLVVGLTLRSELSSKPLTDVQVTELSASVERFFAVKIAEQQRVKSTQTANIAQSGNKQAIVGKTIMAVIYKKPDATWFIKAQAQTRLINQQAKLFSDLFLQQLSFTNKNIPDFSHVPEQYAWSSTEKMRFASFNLNGVDVSVTKLGPNQNVTANVNRWKGQLGLPSDAPGFVKYQDDNQTVLVRLNSMPDQPQNNQPRAPEKENLNDFIQLNLSDKWQQVDTSSGMASGRLLLTDAGENYDISILRLPINVPIETILGIWKQRLQLPADTKTTSTNVSSNAGQIWQLTPLSNLTYSPQQPQDILIAVHKGKTKYTFMRLSNTKALTESAKKEFISLLKTAKVIKP